jgi:hypothetical protein
LWVSPLCFGTRGLAPDIRTFYESVFTLIEKTTAVFLTSSYVGWETSRYGILNKKTCEAANWEYSSDESLSNGHEPPETPKAERTDGDLFPVLLQRITLLNQLLRKSSGLIKEKLNSHQLNLLRGDVRVPTIIQHTDGNTELNGRILEDTGVPWAFGPNPR